MKKRIKKTTALILFILTCVTANAQFFLGPQVGLNIATLTGTDLTVNSKYGLHAGLFFNIPVTKHIALMPAVLYSMKGFKYDYKTSTTATQPDTSGNNITSTINVSSQVNTTLGYIDIPLFLTWWSGEQQGFFIQAGPQLSFLISDNADINASATVNINGSVSQPSSPVTTNKLGFHKSDVALIGGIGYKFPFLLMLYARASTGFAKVQEGDFVKDSERGNNFVIEAGAALTFGPK